MPYVARKGGGSWKKTIDQKWWDNQKDALASAHRYLKNPGGKQAMVRMPTGTGKTGVIATLAQLLADQPRCLVVAPWTSLVQQLKREIADRWWVKVSEKNSLNPKQCISFTPKLLRDGISRAKKDGVLLCTHQTLQGIHRDAKLYGELKKWCSLVLVDEGHREPAPQWSLAVRELGCTTILFTATPYRNDLRLFDVSSDFFYTYTFPEALLDKIVRSVHFEEAVWTQSGKTRTSEFTDILLAAVARNSASAKDDVRVIVRCETEAEVRDVVEELARRNESVIGIHEQFKQSLGNRFLNKVPDPAKEDAQYWVHQWKLLEGLDDPRFRQVAIYSRFTNARNLVQQIGRVIRNPGRRKNQYAWVLVHQDHGQTRLWDNFLGYEAEVHDRKNSGRSELTIFDDFVQSHLSTPRFYLLGDFRRGLSSGDVSDPRQNIRMRKSVLVFKPKRKFAWQACMDAAEKELLGENAIPFGSPYRTDKTYLQLYQLLEQSPVVTEAFMDVGLGYVFVGLREGLLYFSDSSGRRFEFLAKHTDALKPDILKRLFPDGQTEIGEVSLISGDFGNHVFRRRTLSTKSLDMVPPSLSDYVQVCSTATGRISETRNGQSELTRRYIGFTRGRLAERTLPVVDFNDFNSWLEALSKKLKDKSTLGSEALLRFALPSTFDGTATDQHILFDIVSEELDHSNYHPTIAGTAEDKLWRITTGKFIGELDDKQFEAKLTYDAKRNKYLIDSSDLEQITIHEPGRPARPLNRYLNEEQTFRVLRSDNSFYSEGKFFKPNALPWRGGGSRLNIVAPVIACAGLQGATSEKGDLTGWNAGSVFGAISDPAKVFMATGLQPDTVICYDVIKPTEIADFFAVSYAQYRIAMIHAKKARIGSKMSASAFYDVCSQAVRYLGFFNPNNSRSRITAAQLDQIWSPDAAKYSPRNRVLINTSGLQTTAKIVSRFEEAVRDPTFTREVWLVMGNGLSRAAFEKAMSKTDPLANEREVALLFQATWSSVAAAGATLKVVCPP